MVSGLTEERRMQSLIFAKTFCVALRRYHRPGVSVALREFIDPAYLERHRLGEGAFPVRTIAVVNIHDIKVSDDPHTILCVVDTEEKRKEAILLRTVLRGGTLHLRPVDPPDPKDGGFTPWILRMKLDSPQEVE